jgi:hypothetical protein
MARGSDSLPKWWASSLGFAVVALSVIVGQPAQAQTNLALNKPATCSPNAQYAASLAVDGNTGTRWSSAQGIDPQWIYVDLGAPTSVGKVVLTWETASAKSYQLQSSNDAVTWSTFYSTTTGPGGTETLTVTASGRYVRMNGTARNTGYGYSLFELAIYAPSATPTSTARPAATATATARPAATATATPSGGVNVALNKACTASASYVSACTNAFDGNAGTRWESAHALDPQWIYVDLGGSYNLTQVVLTWETASAKSFEVDRSADAVTWTSMYSTTTGPGGTQTLSVSGSGRYVRMFGTVRNTTYGYSLWEFAVYGTPSGATPTSTSAPRATATATSAPRATATTVAATATATASTVQCTKDSDCASPNVCGHGGQCMAKAALSKSNKRGLPIVSCGGTAFPTGVSDSRGNLELDALKGGITWFYNWGAQPHLCNDSAANDSGNSVAGNTSIDNFADGRTGIEFVPMIWGFAYGASHNGVAGANCADSNNDQIPDGPCFRVDNIKGPAYCQRAGGPCAGVDPELAQNPKHPCYECEHEVIDYNTLLNRIPLGSKYLLVVNEPNFYEQASMSPAEVATMWKYAEKVASVRGLQLVSPAVNYCGPTNQGGNGGAGECIPMIPGNGANRDPQLFAWLDEFYYQCEAGRNGRTGSGNYSAPNVGNCKVDFSAYHVYSADSSQTWSLGKITNWRNHDGVNDPVFSYRILTDANVQAHANGQYWVTEFAPEYTGVERNTVDRLNDNVNEFEASGDIFRYSWFMSKVSPAMKSLDLDDIACSTKNTSNVNTSTVTNAGQCYLKHPIGVRNVAGQPGYVNECDFLNHPAAVPTYCCDDNFYGVCVRGMLKTCATNADCADANNVCSFDGSTTGVCKSKGCLVDTDCANGYVCDGEDQAHTPPQWNGSCRPSPHPLNNEPAHH